MDWSGLLKSASPAIGGLLGQFFGGSGDDHFKNPADAAMNTIGGIPGALKPYYDTYMDAGKSALPTLQSQFGNLIKDPGNFINNVGQSYQQSPGFQASLKEALNAATNAAAAGGYAGSPQHERYSMEAATNLANKDYNDWLSKALGAYGMGLGGEQNIFQTGFDASKDYAGNVGNTMMNQAMLQFSGQQAENERNKEKQERSGSLWGELGSLAGAAIPFLF